MCLHVCVFCLLCVCVSDLFLEHIKSIPLKETMPDYKGIFQEQSAVPFIINTFMSHLKTRQTVMPQIVYTYTVNATGTFVLFSHTAAQVHIRFCDFFKF